MAIDTVRQAGREECDTLTKKLAQLQAMLLMTYGEARESFSYMNDALQDNFLWACSDMADECLTLSRTVSDTVYRHGVGTVTPPAA